MQTGQAMNDEKLFEVLRCLLHATASTMDKIQLTPSLVTPDERRLLALGLVKIHDCVDAVLARMASGT